MTPICQLNDGVPIGPPNFVRQQLEDKSAEQDLLFHRVPVMEDTQVCWVLLFMCAGTRANFWLRAVHPDQSESFSVRHDTNVWRCTRAVLGVEAKKSARDGCVLSQVIVPFGQSGVYVLPIRNNDWPQKAPNERPTFATSGKRTDASANRKKRLSSALQATWVRKTASTFAVMFCIE